MDEKDIAALQNAEIDYEDIIDRFEGNESLYLKLAELFLDDPHMANIEAAFAEGNLDQAECESHARKGRGGQSFAHESAPAGNAHERPAESPRRASRHRPAPHARRSLQPSD